mmetsp:Transcript_90831/g.236637  ORF Transcript_90831/g.236637 Transcript_90831/m.236637 type:complete len:305 (-) Transcript_90831:352-1266(-)
MEHVQRRVRGVRLGLVRRADRDAARARVHRAGRLGGYCLRAVPAGARVDDAGRVRDPILPDVHIPAGRLPQRRRRSARGADGGDHEHRGRLHTPEAAERRPRLHGGAGQPGRLRAVGPRLAAPPLALPGLPGRGLLRGAPGQLLQRRAPARARRPGPGRHEAVRAAVAAPHPRLSAQHAAERVGLHRDHGPARDAGRRLGPARNPHDGDPPGGRCEVLARLSVGQHVQRGRGRRLPDDVAGREGGPLRRAAVDLPAEGVPRAAAGLPDPGARHEHRARRLVHAPERVHHGDGLRLPAGGAGERS